MYMSKDFRQPNFALQTKYVAGTLEVLEPLKNLSLERRYWESQRHLGTS